MGYADLYYEGLLRANWTEIVGQGLQKMVQLERFRQGAVFVRVASPLFLVELKGQEAEILRRIHKVHPALRGAKRLEFTVG